MNKNILFTFLLAMTYNVLSKAQNTLTIESGHFVRTMNDPNYTLGPGSGPRADCNMIQFKNQFSSPPTVVTSLVGIDLEPAASFVLTTGTVEASEFILCGNVWGETFAFQYQVNWIAYGLASPKDEEVESRVLPEVY